MADEKGCPTCGTSYIGIEIQGVYDGILFWQCAAGHRWHRWPHGTWQHDAAQLWIDTPAVPSQEQPRG